MKIGISTYAFFWEFTSPAPDPLEKPMNLKDMLVKTKEFGGEVFQICDYEPLNSMSNEELLDVAKAAKDLGIEIELGTRGVHPQHLKRYLEIANIFEAKIVRTMINDKMFIPTLDEAVEWINEVLPAYEASNVNISLENYEQVLVKDLVSLVKTLNHPNVGVCLDPVNSLGVLEHQEYVIQELAPFVNNLHVKDFTVSRRGQWVGFSIVGCPLGEGFLKLDTMLEALKQEKKDPNAIIELWLPFGETKEDTLQQEDEWIRKSIEHLRRKISC